MSRKSKYIILILFLIIQTSYAFIVKIPIYNIKQHTTDATHYNGLYWTIYYVIGDKAALIDASWLRTTSYFEKDTLYIIHPFTIKVNMCNGYYTMEMIKKSWILIRFSTYESVSYGVVLRYNDITTIKENEYIIYEPVYIKYNSNNH